MDASVNNARNAGGDGAGSGRRRAGAPRARRRHPACDRSRCPCHQARQGRPIGPTSIAATAASGSTSASSWWPRTARSARVRGVLGFIIGEIRAWEFGSTPCGWVFALSVEPKVRLAGVGSALVRGDLRGIQEGRRQQDAHHGRARQHAAAAVLPQRGHDGRSLSSSSRRTSSERAGRPWLRFATRARRARA